MNGFELKEKIEVVKKQLKENERLLTRDPSVFIDKTRETVTQEYLTDLFETRTALQENLTKLEVLQERFNLETILDGPSGKKVSLAECIKLRGMVDSTNKLLQNSVLLLEGITSARYRQTQTKDSVYIPELRYDKSDIKLLPELVAKNDEYLGKIKALIAEGNSRTIRE